ncbi:hypothetical protein G5B37_11205 [Rasiella rasia]|uniref:Uncharacterized protein n=1 Tax=Rasiella rasia TaxID=2744027 RepID=A0A6G6GNH8_9FLAO|nr:hypothetical protein [Rasiella rasia]QIE60109.1 hypothetical protein G5B37_11205 [Rasiella rasia]
MKKILLGALLLMGSLANAQDLKTVLLDEDYAVDFIGLDFSKTKFVGNSDDFNDATEIKIVYLKNWNNLFVKEADKYNMADFLRKENVYVDIDAVKNVNKSVVEEEMITMEAPEPFTKEQLQEMTKRYDLQPKNEVSVVFIVNAFNKYEKESVIHVVHFKSATGEILRETLLRGDAGGFGFRNYWAGSYFNIMEQLKKKQYKAWKKEFKN